MISASKLALEARPDTSGYQGGLARSLVRTLLVFTFIPLFLMAGGAYLRARALLRDQVVRQMRVQIADQIGQIELSVKTKEIRLDRLARSPDMIAAASRALAAPQGLDFEVLQREFNRAVVSISPVGGRPTFSQYFLAGPDATVRLGTVPDWMGLSLKEVVASTELLAADRESFAVYNPAPLYTNQVVLFTISQCRRPDGTLLGTLVGVTESHDLQSILQGLATPSSGAEALFATEDGFIIGTDPYTGEMSVMGAPAAETATILSALDRMMGTTNNIPESIQFTNQAGARTFGQVLWLSRLHVGLVYYIEEARVFGALSSLIPFTAGILVAAVLAMGIVLSIGADRIFRPLAKLAEIARGVAHGDFSQRAHIRSEDEVGLLAASFNGMADQLEATISNLERRVAERTRELELQTLLLRTAAEVARDVTVATRLDEMLDRAARLIFDRFELREVGIFLLDDKKEFAVLRSSPTEAGKRMVREGQRVRVGDRGAVGQVAATGAASLAPSAGGLPASTDSLRPGPRSQLALPLRTNEGLIGVLDLQSADSDTFAHGGLSTMQVLADQLATAVERSRLLVQVQDRLAQLEESREHASADAWGAYGREGPRGRGYTYNNVRLDPITSIPAAAQAALDRREALVAKDTGSGASIAVPIKLRDRVLGVVQVNFQSGGSPESTVGLIQQAADRLGSSLENVRLLEDSERRANSERTISEITAKISSSINMRNMLQTAAEELGRALPGSDVRIKLHRQVRDQDQEVRT